MASKALENFLAINQTDMVQYKCGLD